VFGRGDTATAPPVAIVNQSFAEKYWPGEGAIGKRLRSIDRHIAGEWRTVVGVVPNIMQNDPLRQTFRPLVYVPFEQEPRPLAAFFLARTHGPPQQLAPTMRGVVQGIDPQVGLERFSTLSASFAFERDFMDAEHSELGKYATVGPIFAIIALVLGTIGLVAVIAHSVSQRTQEIGVRMAIGAAARDISQMIVREAMTPVSAGVAIGLAAALAVNRVMHSQLVGVSPYDPLTIIGAPLVLIVVALAACHMPARRATRVDPVVALRHE
jgi:putative ABC transport system permease protein